VELGELKVTRYEVDEAVATNTLHRPERLNAWTGRMSTEYRALLARAADDPSVRVVVVTGAGRGFCAGADTRALEGHVERGGYDPGTGPGLASPGYGVRPEFDAELAYHFGIPKPILAAINGPVVHNTSISAAKTVSAKAARSSAPCAPNSNISPNTATRWPTGALTANARRAAAMEPGLAL
jgi:1,4-dihydroxy-2-naphthoyl-CoA synthase